MIGAGWFAPSQTYYLQAANFAGYLAGALLYRPLTSRFPPRFLLRTTMLIASAALLACALPVSFWWFAFWRMTSGLTGAVLLVVAPVAVLPSIAPRRAGIAGGAIFAGVAVGIVATGTFIPVLLRLGLTQTWIALALLALLMTLVAWNGWPNRPQAPILKLVKRAGILSSLSGSPCLSALYVEYALAAAALVPHMVFLVDYVARGLGYGLEIGALCWSLFGLSAIGGSLLFGWLGDRVGFRVALRLVFFVEAVAVLLPALSRNLAFILVSICIVGAFVTGASALVIGRIGEFARESGSPQGMAWSFATIAFAFGQTIAAYGFSLLFAASASYTILFFCGSAVLALAIMIDIWSQRFACP